MPLPKSLLILGNRCPDCHPERNEVKSKDLRMIDGARILRLPLVAQNDTVYDTFS